MELTQVLQDSKPEKSPKAPGTDHRPFPKAGDTNHPAVVMATIQDDDERLLARIGYRQVS